MKKTKFKDRFEATNVDFPNIVVAISDTPGNWLIPGIITAFLNNAAPENSTTPECGKSLHRLSAWF